MAMELGFQPKDLLPAFHKYESPDDGLLLLEWLEDLQMERFGRCFPIDENATARRQAESPSEKTLLPDPDEIMQTYLNNHCIVPGSDDEPDDWHGKVGQLLIEAEKNAPVSVGEIQDQDASLLRRQENFRKAARCVTSHLAKQPEITKIVLFGSTAIPLWKEVPSFFRFRHKRIKLFHECANIDLAIWVTSPAFAPALRRIIGQTVNELVEKKIHLSAAPHDFCLHLVKAQTKAYLGMVCHYNRCPKRKPACEVPGCGENAFVRILPGFHFKPNRLGPLNSQVLFER